MEKQDFIAIVLLLLLSSFVSAVNAGEISSVDGVAILGYDPVGYFTADKPVQGRIIYSHTWKSSEWRFATEYDRDLFAEEPEKYTPQFGGFCANGLSQGHKIEADPEIWLILDAKLYLFFSDAGRERWINTDYKRRLLEAKETWQQLKYE